MYLMYGVSCSALALLGMAAILVICANPRQPEWLKDALCLVSLPMMIGLFVIGVGLFVKYAMTFGEQPLALGELGVAAAVIAVTAFLMKMFEITKYLAADKPRAAAINETHDNIIVMAEHNPADTEATQITMPVGSNERAPKAA